MFSKIPGTGSCPLILIVQQSNRMLSQGFRKYLSHAKDHEELLAFILGQMVKDNVCQHQLMTGTQPNKVVVTTEALETWVGAT
jgi:hypothetical protein